MIKVSVILPVYNAEEYLNECLDSIVNQTLKDIEIICINDGSTDNSLDILETYAKNDKRIKIISKENGGLGAARNIGLKNSSGEFISFIDSDDFIELNMLEELYNNAISNQSDVVVFKFACFNEDSSKLDYSIQGFDFDNIFNDVDFDNFTFDYHNIKKYVLNASFATWTKLYNREYLFNNNFEFDENIVFEDVPFHIKVILNTNKISFSPNFFYCYRHNPNSLVNTSENGFDIFKIIDIVENYLKDNYYFGEFKNEFDHFKIVQILNYILSTQSEIYFQKAKEEFSKMKLSSTNILDNYLIERFELVLNSNSLYEYIEGHYEIKLADLNGIISNLNTNITELNLDIDNLNNIREKLIENKQLLLDKNKELKFEIDCITENNVKLTKKNVKLTKKNSKLTNNNKKLKKINDLVLNSTSWKITKPMRAFTNLLRKITLNFKK